MDTLQMKKIEILRDVKKNGEIVEVSNSSLDEELKNTVLSREEILVLLNSLLEAERAGARAVSMLSHQTDDTDDRKTLRNIAVDEGRFCAMLTKHIIRLDGLPSIKTGEFLDKVISLECFEERLTLLDRGQSWVVRKIQGVLSRISDERLHGDLLDMLKVHENNIEQAASIRKSR